MKLQRKVRQISKTGIDLYQRSEGWPRRIVTDNRGKPARAALAGHHWERHCVHQGTFLVLSRVQIFASPAYTQIYGESGRESYRRARNFSSFQKFGVATQVEAFVECSTELYAKTPRDFGSGTCAGDPRFYKSFAITRLVDFVRVSHYEAVADGSSQKKYFSLRACRQSKKKFAALALHRTQKK